MKKPKNIHLTEGAIKALSILAIENGELQAAFAGDQVRMYQHLLETQQEPGNLHKCLSKWHALELELHKCLLQHIERAERWQLAEIAALLHYRQELKALQGEKSPTNNNQ